MNTYCYMRIPIGDDSPAKHQRNDSSLKNQKTQANACAEQHCFKVVKTGSSRLDVKILSKLITGRAQLIDALIVIKE